MNNKPKLKHEAWEAYEDGHSYHIKMRNGSIVTPLYEIPKSVPCSVAYYREIPWIYYLFGAVAVLAVLIPSLLGMDLFPENGFWLTMLSIVLTGLSYVIVGLLWLSPKQIKVILETGEKYTMPYPFHSLFKG